MNARIAVAVATLLLLGACSDTSEPNDAQGSSETPSAVTGGADEQRPFTHRALAICTQAVNSALSSAPSPGVEVLEATLAEDAPGTEQIEAWTTAYDDRLELLRGVRQMLSSASSEDEEDQKAWQIVIDSDLVEVAETQARHDLLATGDWERIRAEWPIVTASVDFEMVPVQPALDQLGLNQSDCRDVYALATVPEDAKWFLTEVTSTCLATTLRRLDAETAQDQRTVLDAIVASLEGEALDDLAPLQQSLPRLIDEWEQTTTDLSTVSSTPIDEAAWADVVDAAQERVEVHTERLDAVRAGDPEQIANAFKPNWEHPALDFRAAGVDRGICQNLAG